MSKIFVRLSADSLHYEELHEVALFLKNQVSNADISIIAPVLSRFSEAFDDFHKKIEPVHLRHLTQELRATDKDRDRCFSHMRLVMLGFLKSSFAEKREAAQRLNNVFTRFDGVQRESYKKASGMYSLMVNILRKDNYPADLELLGLSDELTRLEELNIAFETQRKSRLAAEEASAPAAEVKAAARLLVACYHELIQTLESCIRLQAVPNHEELVSSVNSLLLDYKTTLAHRRAYLKSKREKKTTEKEQQKAEAAATAALAAIANKM